MGQRLERFGEVRIIDEMNGFGLDVFKKTESGFWSAIPDMGAAVKQSHLLKINIKLFLSKSFFKLFH